MNIAILGMGVVGGGVYSVISEHKQKISLLLGEELNIKYILDKRKFPGHPLENAVTDDINVILNDDSVKVVAETMGGDKPAYDFSLECIRHGKSVVTSNKLVVEKHGKELSEEAKKHGVSYLFEASVGGGIPVIHPIMNCLNGNKIKKVYGILNGTTNFILEQMEKNDLDFETALTKAQSLGYAEANPAADIEGMDAARKICILSSLCFGKLCTLDDVSEISGISDISSEMVKKAISENYRIKLIGYAEENENKISLFVKPCLVSCDKLLYSVCGVFNCITVVGDSVGEIAFYGHGAGGVATASAVVSDILEAISVKTKPVSFETGAKFGKDFTIENQKEISGKVFPVI